MKFLGDFIDGNFLLSEKEKEETFHKVSPSDRKDEILSFFSSFSSVKKACKAAKKAFPLWRDLDFNTRKKYLLKLKKAYQKKEDEMAKTISRETGKPLWETKGEAKALSSKIDITLQESLKLVETKNIAKASGSMKGVIRYQARGALSVIGPFNFPAHLPNGHFVPALLLGNTVVFKPSDKTPATGQLIAEIFKSCEFPPGVFNMVQGAKEIGQSLAEEVLLDGLLFTGSYDVGLKIKKQTLNHAHKILALEMGGKNTSLIWKDCDIKRAVYENLMGSFITAGQRCSCTSKIFVHRQLYDEFSSKFLEATKNLQIGHWKEKVFYGSLIDEDSQKRYLQFQDIAIREGAEALLKGEKLEKSHIGYYVSPSVHLISKPSQKSIYQTTEIFGPSVGIYPIDSFEEAISFQNSSNYGLAMSVFSKDKKIYEESTKKAKVGILNWNKSTVGASSRLPFGGRGFSGNDRPSGSFAVYYCSSPVASLEGEFSFKKGRFSLQDLTMKAKKEKIRLMCELTLLN